MPPRGSVQRLEDNCAALRDLVNSRSFRVVRHQLEDSELISRRRIYPLPSIGFRSGKLTVTGYLRSIAGGFEALIVKCDCGREYSLANNAFKTFRSTRCTACAKF